MNILLPLLFLITFQHVPYRVLTWEDFRGEVPKSGMSSTTTTAIELTTSGEDGRYVFGIEAYFDPNASWARVKDSATLVHENYHFALTYIWARRIERALDKYQGTGMRAAAEATYDHLIQEWNRAGYKIRTRRLCNQVKAEIPRRSPGGHPQARARPVHRVYRDKSIF